ncbi:MAG: hypothetical protein WCO47_12170 [Methylococcus sp.]
MARRWRGALDDPIKNPSNTVQLNVDVSSQDHEIGIDSRKMNRTKLEVKITEDVDAHEFYSQNVDVLPPGHGRAVGVDVVGLMPAGSDFIVGCLFYLKRSLWLPVRSR